MDLSSLASGATIGQVTMAGDKTLALTDAGKHIYRSSGTLTIPPNASVAFPTGSVITLVNNGTSMSIARGASVILYRAANTSDANATLAAKGICTLLKVDTNTWYASGAGLK